MNLFQLTKNSVVVLNKQHSQVAAYCMLSKLPTIRPKPDPLVIEDEPIKVDTTSKAMKLYLTKVTAYNNFMNDRRVEFEIGKRHLANIMGRDPEMFTQQDIDESIEYLFPCGLFQKKARPMMKPPEEIFPAKKEAQFDVAGRPFHFLFYTGKPNYYQTLHDAVKIIKELNDFEDKVICGRENDPNLSKIILDTSIWKSKDKVAKVMNENISDKDYEELILTIDRIATHPFGKKVEDFIFKFRDYIITSMNPFELLEPALLEDGRQKITFENCKRRTVMIDLSVTHPGTGKFTIEGQDIRYFKDVSWRETVLFPLILSKMLNKVDVEVTNVRKPELGSGDSALANSIRCHVARGIFHFVDADIRDKLKLAGLLQKEVRNKERKKPGQEGARRKFTWKKR